MYNNVSSLASVKVSSQLRNLPGLWFYAQFCNSDGLIRKRHELQNPAEDFPPEISYVAFNLFSLFIYFIFTIYFYIQLLTLISIQA